MSAPRDRAHPPPEFFSGRVFFVLACARSGSTSLARILDGASNAVCAVEPAPNLNWETREAAEGRLDDPRAVVEELIVPRVASALGSSPIYGEKNLTYGPFVHYLYERFRCRFVFITRDGPEVVRSLMDWHNRMFGTVYREAADPGRLAPRALAAAAQLPVHLDTSDYSRPRPRPGSPHHSGWEHYDRAQMCAWYWAEAYRVYFEQLAGLPATAWTHIDYTRPAADDIMRVAAFLGLEGLSAERVSEQLRGRINSLRDRDAGEPEYPCWAEWTPAMREAFTDIAGDMVERLTRFANAPPAAIPAHRENEQ